MARRFCVIAIGLLGLVLAGCNGSARPVAQPGGSGEDPAPPATPIPFAAVGTSEQAKLSPLFVQKWRAGHFQVGGNTPVIVRGGGAIGDSQRADLELLGAEHVRAVTTSDGGQGALHTVATRAASDAVFAHVPDEQLIAVAGLLWVTRLEIAASYPAGPELPDDVARRLDPGLLGTLSMLRRDRPIHVGGLGKTSVCLDEDRRKTLAAAGATIETVASAPNCQASIFTFTIETQRLVELASIPWIVRLEGGRPMYPENALDRSE